MFTHHKPFMLFEPEIGYFYLSPITACSLTARKPGMRYESSPAHACWGRYELAVLGQ